MLAFFIEKKLDHLRRRYDPEFFRAELPRFPQYLAQDVVGDAARRLDDTFAQAGSSGLAQLVRQRLAGSLAGHFEQAER